MNIIKFSEFLNEKNLSIPELKKVRGGDIRGNILVKKLKENPARLPISSTKNIIVKNADVILSGITDASGNYDNDSAEKFFKQNGKYKKDVIKTFNKMYSLDDIYKSKDFGSSRGTSLGTISTRKLECIQAAFLSYRRIHNVYLNERNIDDLLNGMTDDGVYIKSEIMEKIRIPLKNIKMNDIYELQESDYGSPEYSWLINIIRTTNEVYDEIMNKTFIRELSTDEKSYTIYHNFSVSETLEKITSTYHRLLKEDPIYKSMKMNIPFVKWNPSDLWIINDLWKSDFEEELEQAKNISEMNKIMDDYFESGLVVGLSLKKTNLKGLPKVRINDIYNLPTFDYLGLTISRNPKNNKGVIVHYYNNRDEKPQSITFRNFTGEDISDICGEINGTVARYGKVSLKYINMILKKYKSPTIPISSEIKNWTEKEKIQSLLLEKIEKLNDELIYAIESKSDYEYYHITDFKKEIKERPDIGYYISKYQSLKLASILMDVDLLISNKIITDIVQYATCMRNIIFDCPQYFIVT